MTDRAALAARFRHAASVWKGTCLAKVDVSAEVCDLDVIADALSTPSASAGPQAEAVAQINAIQALSETEDADVDFLIEQLKPASSLWRTIIKSFRRQIIIATIGVPQQADGRGAVIDPAVITVPFNPCLAKLRPGEPFFVLLGRDKQAPNAVMTWANDREAAEGKSAWTDQAREVYYAMVNYRAALQQSPAKDGPAK